jgi:periplasmic protein TonB
MRAAAQARRIYRPCGRRLRLPQARARTLPLAARTIPSSRSRLDEAINPELSAAPIDARWHSPEPRRRSWHGALLSLGLHLGTVAVAVVLMLQASDGASSSATEDQSIEVEIVGADTFDQALSASGAQPQAETKSVEAPLPDIPLPPDLPLPTEQDLVAKAEEPTLPPVPDEPMPDPMEVLKREIAQSKPQEQPLAPPDNKPEPPKQVAKAKPPRKPAPEKPAKAKREAARGQGESGKETDATSSLAATRGAQGRAGSAGGNAAANPSFRASVMAHLARYKRYPEAARIQRMRGRVMVTFSLDASGTVTGVSLAGSSGLSLLDSEALAMVHRASPFPRIPPETGQASASFTAPIVYDMN